MLRWLLQVLKDGTTLKENNVSEAGFCVVMVNKVCRCYGGGGRRWGCGGVRGVQWRMQSGGCWAN